MTCRKPTISVRMEVLQRLARANADPQGPDSLEFAPVSWRDLDRDSFTEGLNELLSYQNERVREEERRQAGELRQQALHRARQRAQARRWEQETVERRRAELLELRIEEARKRAAMEVQDQLTGRRAVLSSELGVRARENAHEHDVAKATIADAKRRLSRTSQAFLAAAALSCAVWVAASGKARSSASEEMAQVWQDSQAQELAAETRVAELEAEIDRRANISESERAWLERELGEARAAFDVSKKESEELDRRRPVERPSKMARALAPVTDSKNGEAKTDQLQESATPNSVRVATDVVQEDSCLAYDPLCFNL